MNRVLVDTCVVSILLKGHSSAPHYLAHLEGRLRAISFMTEAELYRWALRRHWGERRREWLDNVLRKYAIVPVDRELCLLWAKITNERQGQGRPISCADAWVAASALRHDAMLLTDNTRDFELIEGLVVVGESARRNP
jgi:tRNA(fMet)-specific endonuclease VapC